MWDWKLSLEQMVKFLCLHSDFQFFSVSNIVQYLFAFIIQSVNLLQDILFPVA